MTWEETQTGREALMRLRQCADLAERWETIFIILEGSLPILKCRKWMDFPDQTHTNDPRLQGLPILMHSSLSGQCNVEKGGGGRDRLCVKFHPTDLRDKLLEHLGGRKDYRRPNFLPLLFIEGLRPTELMGSLRDPSEQKSWRVQRA